MFVGVLDDNLNHNQGDFMSENKFDVVGAMMDFENGDLTEEKIIELFQHLLETGTVFKLQGFYGRVAKELYRQGLIHV